MICKSVRLISIHTDPLRQPSRNIQLKYPGAELLNSDAILSHFAR